MTRPSTKYIYLGFGKAIHCTVYADCYLVICDFCRIWAATIHRLEVWKGNRHLLPRSFSKSGWSSHTSLRNAMYWHTRFSGGIALNPFVGARNGECTHGVNTLIHQADNFAPISPVLDCMSAVKSPIQTLLHRSNLSVPQRSTLHGQTSSKLAKICFRPIC